VPGEPLWIGTIGQLTTWARRTFKAPYEDSLNAILGHRELRDDAA
jgi:hypothetical protein